jgi:hypothetical protein
MALEPNFRWGAPAKISLGSTVGSLWPNFAAWVVAPRVGLRYANGPVAQALDAKVRLSDLVSEHPVYL